MKSQHINGFGNFKLFTQCWIPQQAWLDGNFGSHNSTSEAAVAAAAVQQSGWLTTPPKLLFLIQSSPIAHATSQWRTALVNSKPKP
jgi:hypothetical protein